MAMAIPALVGAIGGGSLATMAATAIGTGLLSKVLTKKPSAPAVQAPEPPPKPTQAPKAAERPAIAAGLAAAARPGGAMAGNSSTFLTGASGIDSSTLNLGKNTLLGQ